MPKASHYDAVTRQWEILKLIPATGDGITAKSIASKLAALGYEVTKRTIERDLADLSRLFSMTYDENNRPYRWKWMKDGGISLPALSLAQSMSLKIIEDTIKPLLPYSLQESMQQLFKEAEITLKKSEKGRRIRTWVEKVRSVPPAMPLIAPQIDAQVMETVQESLLKDKQVELEYKSMGSDAAKKQLLNPLGMVQRGQVTYLVASMDPFDDVRLYAMHRMASAKTSEKNVETPQGFSLEDYISEGALNFSTGEKITLEIKVDEWLGRILQETPLSEGQVITLEGDWMRIKAVVDDSWQLRWWILSQGAAIEVARPLKLRKQIFEEVRKCLGMYKQ